MAPEASATRPTPEPAEPSSAAASLASKGGERLQSGQSPLRFEEPDRYAEVRLARTPDDPPDATPPSRRLVVVDLVELGPLGAVVRAAVEREFNIALAVGGPEVHDQFEQHVDAQGGPEAVLSWLIPTLVERRRSGGPLPGSVAYLDRMLSDRPAAPLAVSPGPWEVVVAYAREASGSSGHQLLDMLSRLTARFEGDDLVITGPAAAMHAELHREDFERLVASALGQQVQLRFEAAAPASAGAGS